VECPGGTVGIPEIADNSRPVIEQEDMCYQAQAADSQRCSSDQSVRGQDADRIACSNKRSTLKNDNLIDADTRPKA
jgi:hypothetical protein